MQLMRGEDVEGTGSVADRYKSFTARVEEWHTLNDLYLRPLVAQATFGRENLEERPPHAEEGVEELEDSDADEDEDEDEDSDDEARRQGAGKGKRKRVPEKGTVMLSKKAKVDRSGPVDSAHQSTWADVTETLFKLPSSYTAIVQSAGSIAPAVAVERLLREGEANDALDDLRAHLITSYAFDLIGKEKTTGQGTRTRMQTIKGRKKAAVRRAAAKYRRTRQILLALGMSPQDETYRPLKQADIKPFVIYADAQKLGSSKKKTSWIWSSFEFVQDAKSGAMQDWCEAGEDYML